MYYLFLIISAVLAFGGCTRLPDPSVLHTEERVLSQYETYDLSELIWKYVTELKYDHRLHLENALVCHDGHAGITLQFSTQHILELCDARALLVDVVEGLIDRVNQMDNVPSYLYPFPITANQLTIHIDFQSFYGEYVDPFYIGLVKLEKGISYFYAFTLKNKKLDIWHSRAEPYDKSLSFVKYQREGEALYRMSHPAKNRKANIPGRFDPQNKPHDTTQPYSTMHLDTYTPTPYTQIPAGTSPRMLNAQGPLMFRPPAPGNPYAPQQSPANVTQPQGNVPQYPGFQNSYQVPFENFIPPNMDGNYYMQDQMPADGVQYPSQPIYESYAPPEGADGFLLQGEGQEMYDMQLNAMSPPPDGGFPQYPEGLEEEAQTAFETYVPAEGYN